MLLPAAVQASGGEGAPAAGRSLAAGRCAALGRTGRRGGGGCSPGGPEGRLAPFDRATTWLNSDPLTPDSLRGRVVLVDFWTYTCVNWLRTLPYLRAWDAAYRDPGA